MKGSMIVGVMVSKDLMSQGYPFLESIYSFLGWGDLLYVGDDSSDPTRDILRRISGGRLRVLRVPWGSAGEEGGLVMKGRRGEAIGRAYSALLGEVRKGLGRGDWVYELQANEVFHEDAYEAMRSLPSLHPGKTKFMVPFRGFHGPYLTEEVWRLRYAWAGLDLTAVGDGYRLGSRESYPVARLAKLLLALLGSAAWAPDPHYSLFSAAEEALEPAAVKPVFRYGMPLPRDSVEKMSRHAELWAGQTDYRDFYGFVEEAARASGGDPQAFWKQTAAEFCRRVGKTGSTPVKVPVEAHPSVMREFLTSRAPSYAEIDHGELEEMIVSRASEKPGARLPRCPDEDGLDRASPLHREPAPSQGVRELVEEVSQGRAGLGFA